MQPLRLSSPPFRLHAIFLDTCLHVCCFSLRLHFRPWIFHHFQRILKTNCLRYKKPLRHFNLASLRLPPARPTVPPARCQTNHPPPRSPPSWSPSSPDDHDFIFLRLDADNLLGHLLGNHSYAFPTLLPSENPTRWTSKPRQRNRTDAGVLVPTQKAPAEFSQLCLTRLRIRNACMPQTS